VAASLTAAELPTLLMRAVLVLTAQPQQALGWCQPLQLFFLLLLLARCSNSSNSSNSNSKGHMLGVATAKFAGRS
jgi:hypothetical protein